MWIGDPKIGMKSVLTLACIVLLLSIGCSAEHASTPSDSRKETNKSHRFTREEARSAPDEDNGEASKPAPKRVAEQSSAKPKPKPVPRPKSQSKPHANPEPKQIPASSEGRGVRGSAVTVSRVVDGDTIEISPVIDGVREVTLIGVDTPETVDPTEGIEPFRPQASAFATRDLTGRSVRLAFDEERIDKYGRLLAYVHTGGAMCNEVLVAKGYA